MMHGYLVAIVSNLSTSSFPRIFVWVFDFPNGDFV